MCCNNLFKSVILLIVYFLVFSKAGVNHTLLKFHNKSQLVLCNCTNHQHNACVFNYEKYDTIPLSTRTGILNKFAVSSTLLQEDSTKNDFDSGSKEIHYLLSYSEGLAFSPTYIPLTKSPKKNFPNWRYSGRFVFGRHVESIFVNNSTHTKFVDGNVFLGTVISSKEDSTGDVRKNYTIVQIPLDLSLSRKIIWNDNTRVTASDEAHEYRLLFTHTIDATEQCTAAQQSFRPQKPLSLAEASFTIF